MKYRVFEPGRGVVSWHRTETGANRALLRHIRRLFRQGDAKSCKGCRPTSEEIGGRALNMARSWGGVPWNMPDGVLNV